MQVQASGRGLERPLLLSLALLGSVWPIQACGRGGRARCGCHWQPSASLDGLPGGELGRHAYDDGGASLGLLAYDPSPDWTAWGGGRRGEKLGCVRLWEAAGLWLAEVDGSCARQQSSELRRMPWMTVRQMSGSVYRSIHDGRHPHQDMAMVVILIMIPVMMMMMLLSPTAPLVSRARHALKHGLAPASNMREGEAASKAPRS